ncbi:MAG TPA: acyl carrier protein [Rhodospirillales bacterium]|nr:acyl carrier protein [Rhodospirillales bacterium]
MTREQWVHQQILEALAMVAPEADTTGLDPRRSFRDQLGIDSIDYLNFIVALEERLGVRIGEADYPQLSTLDGCVAYLKQPIGPAGDSACR